MADRVSSLDASFLYLEEPTTVMHAGSVMVFHTGPSGFDYARLQRLIGGQLTHLPRYRQRIREVPGRLANPVWVDDEHFELSYHVRRSALPRPGSDEQLEEFVARVMPRPLDRARPLWEVYLVEGLEHGRFGLVTKTHHALVDESTALDITQLIVGEQPQERDLDLDPDEASSSMVDAVDGLSDDADPLLDGWRPRRGPTDAELVTGALVDALFMPGQVIDSVREGLDEAREVAGRVASGLGSLVSTVARGAARPAPSSPLNVEIGSARRFVLVGTDLDDYRKVRARLTRGPYADEVSVNDVVLATVAGAFRAWLLTRGEPVHPSSVVRAMVPVSVDASGPLAESDAHHRLTACFIDLPVGSPVPRCACTRSRSRCASRSRVAPQ